MLNHTNGVQRPGVGTFLRGSIVLYAECCIRSDINRKYSLCIGRSFIVALVTSLCTTNVFTVRQAPGDRIARNNVIVAAMADAIRIQGTASAQQDTQESVVRLNARKDPMDLIVRSCVNARTAPHVV
eukprot:XP_011420278.1 PREDICTED: uncharacterized protein LOC105323032 [Crassostrea gigas]